MNMNVAIEDIDSCTKKIKFDISQQDYKSKIRSYYQTLGKEVKIPGFRKGKAPVSLLEKQYGPEVKKEVLTKLINERMISVIQEKGLRAVSPPSLLEVHAEEGTDINVSASVEVLPEFQLKDYSGIEVEVKIPKVTDEDRDRVIEVYRERASETTQVTDRPARKKDLIKIDFKGTLDGKPFEGNEVEGYVLELGTQQLLGGMEEGLTGMKIGEEKDLKIKVPENFPGKAIAGKDVDFHVALKGIQEKKLPELDDEFARKADPKKNYENLKDMKIKILQELEDYESKQARKAAQKQLAEKITEMNPIDVPEGLVQEQIRYMTIQAHKINHPAASHEAGHSHDHSHEPQVEVTQADIEKHRAGAVKILQQELLIDKLAQDLKIEVAPEELDAEIKNFVNLLGGGSAEKIKKEWEKSGALDRLHNRMRREKTLEATLGKVKIKEEFVDRKEIIPDNQ